MTIHPGSLCARVKYFWQELRYKIREPWEVRLQSYKTLRVIGCASCQSYHDLLCATMNINKGYNARYGSHTKSICEGYIVLEVVICVLATRVIKTYRVRY